jgi:hypothetical protein
LAGKTKTRQGGVTARVDGTTLILEGVRGTQDVLIDLRGCMVREPPEEFGLQNGIEIIRGEHKLKVGMLEVDYIFLTFSRGAPLRDFWLGSLIANCFCKAATGDDLVSKKERQLADRETAIVHKGVMAVEWGSEGVAQQQMWAVLDALPCLTLYDSASNPTMCVRLYMADTTSCFHVDPEKRRFRVQGVSRPLYHLSQGRISVDYVFLTATQATFASWKSAFESVKPQDRDLNLLDFTHVRPLTGFTQSCPASFKACA